jgi:hypothetical protein
MLQSYLLLYALCIYTLSTINTKQHYIQALCITKMSKDINIKLPISINSCNEELSNKMHNLTRHVYHSRLDIEEFIQPFVETSIIFNGARPKFVISLPVHNAAGHIRSTLEALFSRTTSIWALDIVLDDCIDESRDIVYSVLSQLISSTVTADSTCQTLCQGQISNGHSNAYSTYRFLTRIRVIIAQSPLWECRSDNVVFASAVNANAEFYVSLQADQVVQETGWNEMLSIPLYLFPDVISVSGKCAHNLRNDIDHDTWNEAGHRCNSTWATSDRLSIDPNTGHRTKHYLAFHIRDSSNRGPLIFRGYMMREMGFFDEQNFLLSNDDHDVHSRAYAAHRWLTGYYPIEYTHIQKLSPSDVNSTKDTNNITHRELINNKIFNSFVEHRDGGFMRFNFRGIKPKKRNKDIVGTTSYQRFMPLRDMDRYISDDSIVHNALAVMSNNSLSRITKFISRHANMTHYCNSCQSIKHLML